MELLQKRAHVSPGEQLILESLPSERTHLVESNPIQSNLTRFDRIRSDQMVRGPFMQRSGQVPH